MCTKWLHFVKKQVNVCTFMYDHTQKKFWKEVEQSVDSEYSEELNQGSAYK